MKIKEFREKYEKIRKQINEADKMYLNEYETLEYNIYTQFIKDLKNVEFELEQTKILLIEDGSIDLENEKEKLNKLGYKVIVYRSGANKPEIL